MIMYIAGEHDQVGLRVGNGQRFVVLEMQVGQNADFQDAGERGCLHGGDQGGLDGDFGWSWFGPHNPPTRTILLV
jgi:hypothetical protein